MSYEPANETEDAYRAQERMAKLIKEEFGIDVPAWRIGYFIRQRWGQLAPLAHIIHEAPDTTKAPFEPITTPTNLAK